MASAEEKRKYKNVFIETKHHGDAFEFTEVGKIWTPKIDSNFCSASGKYLCVHTESVCRVFVCPVNAIGRYSSCPKLTCSQKVNFSAWCPYNDSMVALATKGSKCDVFQIPEGCFGEDGKLTQEGVDLKPVATLETPSQKDLICVQWHPTAQNIIAVVSKEKNGANIFVYDIATSELLYQIDSGSEVCSLIWSCDGSKLIYTNRAKNSTLFINDPRTEEPATEVATNLKEGQVFYCAMKLYGAKKDYIGVSGIYEKTAMQRTATYAFWDAETLEEVYRKEASKDTFPLIPYFDSGRCTLWMYQKAACRVIGQRFFVVDGEIYFKKTQTPAALLTKHGVTGGCFMPQRGLDYDNIEVQRFYALSSNKGNCFANKIIVPRKVTGNFDPFFYPEFPGLVAPCTSEEYQAGENKDPVMWSLDPAIERDATGAAVFKKKATYQELEKALEIAKGYLTEEQIASLGL